MPITAALTPYFLLAALSGAALVGLAWLVSSVV